MVPQPLQRFLLDLALLVAVGGQDESTDLVGARESDCKSDEKEMCREVALSAYGASIKYVRKFCEIFDPSLLFERISRNLSVLS